MVVFGSPHNHTKEPDPEPRLSISHGMVPGLFVPPHIGRHTDDPGKAGEESNNFTPERSLHVSVSSILYGRIVGDGEGAILALTAPESWSLSIGAEMGTTFVSDHPGQPCCSGSIGLNSNPSSFHLVNSY